MSRKTKNDDSWLLDLSKKLDKKAVQPMRQSIYEQINNIMNNGAKSKFSTVQEVVDDMKERSGLNAMISKVSNETGEPNNTHKVANNFLDNYPEIINTTINIIESSNGLLPVPAIIDKIRTLHNNDVDNSFFDDDRYIAFVNKENLRKKSDDNLIENNSNLGKHDEYLDESNEPWNRDMFFGINA